MPTKIFCAWVKCKAAGGRKGNTIPIIIKKTLIARPKYAKGLPMFVCINVNKAV